MTTPPEVEYLTIPLSQGQVMKVSLEDEWLAESRYWHAVFNKKVNGFYAVTNLSESEKEERLSTLFVRQILGLNVGDPRRGDHINHNTLDNRRSNLRIVSNSQNAMNSFKHKDGSSRYKGVSWDKNFSKRPWHSQISKDRIKYHLGNFTTEELAHLAYCYKAEELFGEYAYFD